MKRALSILSAAALLFASPVIAQNSTIVEEAGYQNKILILPALGSTPEMGFMFGAVVVPQSKMSGSGPETRSSSLFISGIYTTKNQILLSLLSDIILPE